MVNWLDNKYVQFYINSVDNLRLVRNNFQSHFQSHGKQKGVGKH